MKFSPEASWIWSDESTAPSNNYVCFRRSFDVAGSLKSALLRITADSRYEVFVNGVWVGHGPIRGWPTPWSVDEYDLRGTIKPGCNVIAVLVTHYGIGTFQYIHASPGLLAQAEYVDSTGPHTLVSDGSWRATPHRAFETNTPRISVQQGWEEQYDARAFDAEWECPGYDDSAWSNAAFGRASGEGEHASFQKREIPFLTRERIEPACVLEAVVVQPAPYTVSVDFRRLHNPEDLTANMIAGGMLAGIYIHTEVPQKIELHQPHGWLETKLNGKHVKESEFTQQSTGAGVAAVRLRAGANLLLVRLGVMSHTLWLVLNAWAEKPIRFSTRPDEVSPDTGVLGIGPFPVQIIPTYGSMPPYAMPATSTGATTEIEDRVWKTGELTAADLLAAYTRGVTSDMVAPVNVFGICTSERVDSKQSAVIENRSALKSDNADWTLIHPANDGASVRILLDFGDELVGYHEFEIDAPAGAIIDNHNFEFIQQDGRRNLAEGMNNTFRYTCREGLQRFRTFVRRGFRYSYLSFRNHNRPIRVRFVRAIFSTYPQARLGSFECSDPMLTRIWEVGAHTVRCCSEDTYTDCPSYEQTYWVGDARNEALVDLVANGDPRLSRHSWLVAAGSLDRSDIVESEVPSAWQNVLPAWTFLWMRWAQEHFDFTGDTEFAERALDLLDRNAQGIEKHLNEAGLFAMWSWSLFDWAPMDTPNDGVVGHVSCLCVLGLRQSARLATQLGQKSRAKKWNTLADRIAKAVNLHLWDEKKNAYIDCIHRDGTRSNVFSQQTQTAAYISGVAQGDRARRCLKIIDNPPGGFVKAGSPFFMFFALEAFAREGRWHDMIDRIRDYWGIQLAAGATTFWETYLPQLPRLTRSHCHGWSAAPTFFLSHHVLGVQPAEPGFKSIRIAPRTGDLKWAHGRMPTPNGPVTCSWKRIGKMFSLDVRLPKSVSLQIELPAIGVLKVIEGKAKKIASKNGTTILTAKCKTLRIEIG